MDELEASSVSAVQTRRFTGAGVLLVALGASIWGTDTLLRAPLSAAFAPVLLVLGEHLVLAFYAIPVVLRGWREILTLNLGRWGALAVVGWGGSAVATILFTTGLFRAFEAGEGSVNTVLLLQQTQPIFAVTAAAIVLGERLTVLYVPIFAVAALGAYLLAFGNLETGLLAPFTQVGQARLGFALAALGAAALWGTSTAMGRYLGERLSFQTLTGARFLMALPLLIVLAAITVPDPIGSFTEALTRPGAGFSLILIALLPYIDRAAAGTCGFAGLLPGIAEYPGKLCDVGRARVSGDGRRPELDLSGAAAHSGAGSWGGARSGSDTRDEQDQIGRPRIYRGGREYGSVHRTRR